MADLGSLLGGLGVGGNIGKAIVQLELDSKKYTAEMNAAKAQTTASANSMGGGLAKFGGIAKTAFLGAGVAAVAFGAFSVKAAIEANDAHLKLQNTFKNNATLSDSSVAAFERQADALRDLTGVDDEAIITSQAMLGQFKLTGAQVQELTPLIVDLSAKMGIDLVAATKAVGKAAIGNTAGLQRYGIVIDEVKGSGTEAAAVLEGLQKTVGGFAEARAAQEPWRVLGAQFEEIAEDVGQALLPALKSFAEALQNLLPILTPLLALLGDLIGLVGDLAAALTLSDSGVEAAMAGWKRLFAEYDAGKITIIELENRLIKLRDQTGINLDVTDAYSSKLQQARDAQKRAAQAAYEWGQRQEEAAGAVEHTTAALHKQLDALLAIADPTFALISAVRDNKSAEDELAAAHRRVNQLADAGKTETKAYAEATADLRDKALAAAQSQAGLFGAVRNLQQEIKSGKTDRKAAIDSIRDLGKAAGLSGEDIRGLVNDIKRGLADAAKFAKANSPTIGKEITAGIKAGLDAGAPGVYTTITSIVNNAIVKAQLEAESKSPSKRMKRLGVDLMVGLANGISDSEQKAIDAAKRAIEKSIAGAEAALEKVQSRASSFRQTISGAFAGFADLGGAFNSFEGGADISTLLQIQLSGAQHLADVLEALKRQGAGRPLLQQVAESGAGFGQALLAGGPAEIEEANAALKTIAGLAQQTGKGLSESFFGDQMSRLRERVDRLGDKLDKLVELEKAGHSHDINVDGQKLAETTRRFARVGAKRNGGSTGFN